ncbi:glycoside hydrolase family 9 protein [Streptomyces paludis]|uniref:glycoside hydrolase family 9 protein n=1 Tax=Streptomyces paludis TaxID=2282738 RepID=UPI0013B442C3|nr:glycoside hydrolase family 9 protein [Streptomyces paludis]
MATYLPLALMAVVTALSLLLGVGAQPAQARAAATDLVVEVDFARPDLADRIRTFFDQLARDQTRFSDGYKALLKESGADVDPSIPDFRAQVQVRDTLVIFTIPAGDVEASTTWKQGILAGTIGAVSYALLNTVCLIYFPAAGLLCGMGAGAVGELLNGTISQAFDGLIKDPEAWKNTIARTLVAGLLTGALGKLIQPHFPEMFDSVMTALERTIERIKGWWWNAGEVLAICVWPLRAGAKLAMDLVRGGTMAWITLEEIASKSKGLQAQFPDLNGDGAADRVEVGADGRISGWRNDARLRWTALGDITPPGAVRAGLDPNSVFFGDVDGDDRDDYIQILNASESPTGVPAMMVWRNESSGGTIKWAAQPVRVANNLGYTKDVFFADIDGDGDDDVLIVGRNNYVTAWENTATGLPSPGDWKLISGFDHPATGPTGQLSFADITGDGRADAVLVQHMTGDVAAWENTGRPWTMTTGWKSLGTIRSGSPFPGDFGVFADLNNDQVADYLMYNARTGGVDGWLLPRYGSGQQGPGQPTPPDTGGLPAGTLPPYTGGQPEPQVSGRLLQNSTFTGTDKPWWVNAGMTPKVDGGVFCVNAPASEKPWDVLVGHNSIYLPTGGSYTLKFKVRTSATANLVVQVAPFDNPTNATYLVKYPSVTGGAWKEYEYTFNTAFSDEYVLAQLQFRLGGAAKAYEFCMDDVTLNGKQYAYRAKTGPAVKVNQHGYLPNGPKNATVLTNATAATAWTLTRVDGSGVAFGLTKPGGYDGSAGASVHTIDFSAVKATGRFRLTVGGVQSHPFDIRQDLYTSLRSDSMRFFYTNRSGIAIDGGIAGAAYARPAGHVASSPGGGDTKVPCQSPKHYVDNWTCDYTLDVTGGWYDAGDHGKYVVNGGIATYQLLNAWERAVAEGSEAALGDSTLAIPERGNGVPDILDEARWNLEFMLKMQVPSGKPDAGMVHHKVHDETWTGPPTLPHLDKKKRELHRPSTAATLNLAAVAAQGARVYKRFDPAFADRLSLAAVRAYNAAEMNQRQYAPQADRIGGGPYADNDVSDEIYWASAQLYLTTKSQRYLDAVRVSRFHKAGEAFNQNGFYWGSVAAIAQLDLARFGTDLSERNQIRGWVTAAADRLISFQRAERFGQTYTPTNGKYDWGSNASILNNQVVLATAYDLTRDKKYADSVFEAFDYLMGRNALGQSYITGYGTNDAKNQHHRWYAKSLDATLPNPPAGSVSGGPNSSLQDPLAASWLHGCAPQLCYVDNIEAWSVNEITINWNSALAWVSAFAADVAGRA